MLRIVTNRIKCEIINLIDLLLRLAKEREGRWFSFVICWCSLFLFDWPVALFSPFSLLSHELAHDTLNSYVSMISRMEESKSVCFYLCIARSKSIDAFCVKFITPPKGTISHRRLYRNTVDRDLHTNQAIIHGILHKNKNYSKNSFYHVLLR